MLEHQKIVLTGVCHDKSLFKKELLKSMAWLDTYEQAQLRTWVKDNFGELHYDVINDVFTPEYAYSA